MKTRTDAEIRAALPAAALAVFDSTLNALQGAEEIYGPGEDGYAQLMLAVVEAARSRLHDFAVNMRAQSEEAYRQGDDDEGRRLYTLALDAEFKPGVL